MPTIRPDPPRGVLQPTTPSRHVRYLPCEDLAPFVEHHWIVEWDLRGQAPQVARTLPHPSVHLTFERGTSLIVGVVTGAFSRTLESKGRVLGVKFHPGGFFPFAQSPVDGFTNSERPASTLFGEVLGTLERELEPLADDAPRVALVEAFLRARLPAPDANVELVRRVVEQIRTDREITKVDEVVERSGLAKRSLQRLFSRYVGVSPKWVIQRYRLHEAAEQIANGATGDWARLAVELGYFDQAHFIRDFRTIIGQTPAEYAATSRAR